MFANFYDSLGACVFSIDVTGKDVEHLVDRIYTECNDIDDWNISEEAEGPIFTEEEAITYF